MSGLIGIVLELKKFLAQEETKITISVGGGKPQKVCDLVENRQYKIPDFQREIRWKKENVLELITDISNNACYLGNIMLSQNGEDERIYYILDGQQRITVLSMIIKYINERYGDALGIHNICNLENESFPMLEKFIDNSCDLRKMTSEEKSDIEKSDIYNQRKQVKVIWKAIESASEINSRKKVETFLEHLEDSKINLMIDTGDLKSIRSFLDVNVKGIRLDNEDIFKAYLFELDSGLEIRNGWREVKQLLIRINTDKTKKEKNYYAIMTVFAHYFHCMLYKEGTYKDLKFKEESLVLSSEFQNQDGDFYNAGTHIIKAIGNIGFMRKFLKNLTDILKIIEMCIQGGETNAEYLALFRGKVDDKEAKVIHNFIKKIFMDSKFGMPKMIAMKYIIEVILNSESQKNDYKKIYGVYLCTVLFIIFDGKKNNEVICDAVSNDNWYEKIMEIINYYLSDIGFEERRLTTLNLYAIHKDSDEDEFRCKSLATVYNFFRIINNGKDSKVIIKKGKFDELYEFLYTDSRFSCEHFIFNKSKKCEINGQEFSYPKEVKNYEKSLFNFLFITKELNSKMENCTLEEKFEYLSEEKIECNYSKKAFEIINEKILYDYPKQDDFQSDKIVNSYREYYSKNIKSRYFDYVSSLLEAVKQELRSQ